MAQIYSTNDKYHYPKVIKVFLVKDKYEAHLWFYRTKDIYEAENNDAIWYISEQENSLTKAICWVDDKYDADILVYQVWDKYDAHWNKGNTFLGRLG